MKNIELIEKLKKFPPEWEIYFDSKENGEIEVTDALSGESDDPAEWSEEEREQYRKVFGELPELPAEFVLLVSE